MTIIYWFTTFIQPKMQWWYNMGSQSSEFGIIKFFNENFKIIFTFHYFCVIIANELLRILFRNQSYQMFITHYRINFHFLLLSLAIPLKGNFLHILQLSSLSVRIVKWVNTEFGRMGSWFYIFSMQFNDVTIFGWISSY